MLPRTTSAPSAAHLLRVERLDGPLRADRHERGRPDLAVRRPEDAGARGAVRRLEREAAITRRGTVTEGSQDSIASPNE